MWTPWFHFGVATLQSRKHMVLYLLQNNADVACVQMIMNWFVPIFIWWTLYFDARSNDQSHYSWSQRCKKAHTSALVVSKIPGWFEENMISSWGMLILEAQTNFVLHDWFAREKTSVNFMKNFNSGIQVSMTCISIWGHRGMRNYNNNKIDLSLFSHKVLN